MAEPEKNNNPPPAPEGKPESPESVAEYTMNKLKELRTAIESKATEPEIKEKIDAASAAMERAKNLTVETVDNAIDTFKINELKKEIELLPETLKNLPEAIGEETVKKAGMLKRASESVLQSIGSAVNATSTFAKNGFEKAIDGLAFIGEKIMGALEKIKPAIAKMLARPFFVKMIGGAIGTEYVTLLQEWLGQDVAMTQLFDEINKRLPEGTIFMGNVNEEKAILQFNDAYGEVKATKPGDYTKVLFFRDIQTNNGIDFNALAANAEGKKMLTMADVAKGAEKYAAQVREEQKNKPAPTPPTTPPTTPA